jgi:hypothetical protein
MFIVVRITDTVAIVVSAAVTRMVKVFFVVVISIKEVLIIVRYFFSCLYIHIEILCAFLSITTQLLRVGFLLRKWARCFTFVFQLLAIIYMHELTACRPAYIFEPDLCGSG